MHWGGKLEKGLSFLAGAEGIRRLFLLASVGRGGVGFDAPGLLAAVGKGIGPL